MVSTATRTALALFVLILTVCTGNAQSSKQGDEVLQRAEQLFEEERFAEAYPLFSQLVSLKPNDPNVNFKFGATALYAGVAKEKAVKHISFALKKGCDDPRAWFYLGKAHHLNYDFAKAEDAYSKYLEKVSPKEKKPLPAQRNLQMCRQGGKLLSNIRDVVVLEKTEAADSDFFRYYNLEEIGGRVLRTPDELLSKFDKKAGLVSVMHYPGDAVTIYFTSYGKDGNSGKDIYRASILPGGSYSTPERLPDVINTEFDEDFAFMHPDGKTFYFASRGHNSMGGYDIFKSNYDPISDTFSQPENLDFAINTPDDDLFYVVDSLKQTAYFASGRSSAQGQLHVYKVMVQSKPLDLMFIAGGYKPEAPGLDKKAKITIFDELTGRPVLETIADASRGGYLLELPKAGMYRIDVMPTGGAVKHTGVFNVPTFNRSVALAQELRVVNEDGIEKLIITNSFDEPLDVNLAELAADALRRRSSLDVNASDEDLRNLEERKNQDPGSLRDGFNLDDLVTLAGFKAGTSPQEVVSMVAERGAAQQKRATQLNRQAGGLLKASAETAQQAGEQLKKAQSIMEEAEKQGAEAVAQITNEYNRLISEADSKAERASQLKEAARRIYLSSTTIQLQGEEQSMRANELNEVIQKGDLDQAQLIFQEQYALENIVSTAGLPAEENTNEALREADRLVNALTGRMEALETERKELQSRKTVSRRELEAASKKNQITQLNIELERVESDLIAVDNEAYLKNQKLADAYRDRRKLELRKELIAEALANETLTDDTEVFSEALLAELDATTEQINDRLNVLRVDDGGATFGLGATAQVEQTDGDEEQRDQNEVQAVVGAQQQVVSEQDQTFARSYPQLAQRAQNAGVELTSVNERIAKWGQVEAIATDEPSYASLRQQVITKQQQQEANELVSFLTPIADDETLSEAERQWATEALSEARTWQNQLNDLPENTPELEQRSPEEVRAVINTRFPEVAEALAGEKGNDLSALARRLEMFDEAEDATLQAIDLLENQLVQATSSNEVERLAKEIAVLQEVKQRLTAEALVDKALVAWENDQRAIIEEDESFVVRTERQIELAETYIETLAKLRERAENSGAQIRVDAIDTELQRANDKVTMQRAELELAVSVDDSTRQATRIDQDEQAPAAAESTVSIIEETTNESRSEAQTNQTTRAARIAEIVESIDNVENETERDRLQAELTTLLKENELSTEQQRVQVSLIPAPVAQASADVVFKEQSAYEKLAAALPEIRSAERKMEDASQAVALMNSQINTATKRSEIKKFERQRDAAEKLRLDGRVERSLAAAPATAEQYEENQQAITLAWEKTSLSDETRKPIGSYLALEQRRVEQNFEAAKALRADAKKRRTLEERSNMLDEALEKEVQAIAIQTRLRAIAESAEQLTRVEPTQLEAVLSGELRFEEVQLRDAQVVGQVAQTTSSVKVSDDKVAEPKMPRDDDSIAFLGVETTAESLVVAPDKDEELLEAPGEAFTEENAAVAAGEEGEEVAFVGAPTDEERAAAEAIIINLRKESGLPELLSQPAAPELADLEELGEEEEVALRPLLEEREVLIDARAALVRSVGEMNTRIETVEQAIRAANSDAEKEGLAVELGTLYRTAEVRYTELADYDKQLMEAEDKIVVRAAEVRSALASLSDEEISSSNNAEATPDVSNDTFELAESLTESLPEAVERAAKEETRAREAKSDVVDYLFTLPEVMVESVFEILDENAYSDEAPIPVDIEMPEGIIYKVQVGAFRNPISPTTFDRFAPLAGERLDNGVTRYTAGVFVAFNSADEAKQSIREMGYSDAFVVAYQNGKRISISEARNNQAVNQPMAETASTTPTATATEERNLAVANVTVESSSSIAEEGPSATDEVALPEFAERWNTSKGAWLTVQIGVYAKPVTLSELYNVSNVMAEVLEGGLVRYTTGKFETVEAAGAARERARSEGVSDAFVTAYIDGRRVSIAEFRSNAQGVGSEVNTVTVFRVQIGGFSGKVPAETARALLLLESKWGVFQREAGGETFYLTRTFSTAEAAERAANEFSQRGATAVEVITE